MLTSIRNYWCQERGHCQHGDLRCLERPAGAGQGKGNRVKWAGFANYTQRRVFTPLKEEALSIFLVTHSSLCLILVFLILIET